MVSLATPTSRLVVVLPTLSHCSHIKPIPCPSLTVRCHQTEETVFGKEYVQDRPRRILKSKHFLSFDTNADMTLALTKDGQLYACGTSADLLKFVFPSMNEPSSREFVPILQDKKIVSASLGTRHAVIVDDKGKAYSWGYNGSWFQGGGQLGHGDRNAVEAPRLIDFLDNYGAKIVQVSCGDRHTVFLTDDGEVLTCGAGEYGRLGVGNTNDALLPTTVEGLEEEDIVQISAGQDHTLALTRNGTIYAWGRNQSGQLGQSDSYMDIYSLEGFPRKVNVFQGEGNADYNVDSSKDSKGQSGPPVVFIEVHAGHGRSTAVCQSGDLYMWGARLAHTPKRVPAFEFNGQKVSFVFFLALSCYSHLCLPLYHSFIAGAQGSGGR